MIDRAKGDLTSYIRQLVLRSAGAVDVRVSAASHRSTRPVIPAPLLPDENGPPAVVSVGRKTEVTGSARTKSTDCAVSRALSAKPIFPFD
ncbi:Hypothetical protein NTJ_07122 [Nesidiocoris tenuis]|uniref:Uncharacterized protein n=1 Tax=Nesidiocoris tenuis TaxID=355587 RepID=A0ABN7AQV6_9HEMI|nr:Hypothetical protein NTJ_07122 [Nesidiocoris tenuis]